MIKKTLLAIGALLVVAYTIGYLIWHNKEVKGQNPMCEAIEVVIKTSDNHEAIIKESDVLKELTRMGIKLKGEPIKNINLSSIEQVLRANPIFHQAEVYLSPHSNTIKISILQKAPFFWVQGGNDSYYVSRNRSIIPTTTSFHTYVPLFTGQINQEMATGVLYDFVQHLDEDAYYRNYFGHGYYSPQEGLVLTPRISNTSIYFGKDASQWTKMLKKLRRFERLVIAHKGWHNIEYIKLYIAPQVIIKEYHSATS